MSATFGSFFLDNLHDSEFGFLSFGVAALVLKLKISQAIGWEMEGLGIDKEIKFYCVPIEPVETCFLRERN